MPISAGTANCSMDSTKTRMKEEASE